jgi:hypothetical protein
MPGIERGEGVFMASSWIRAMLEDSAESETIQQLGVALLPGPPFVARPLLPHHAAEPYVMSFSLIMLS